MAEFATVQLRVAEATASIDAAQLMIHRDLRETSEVVRAGKVVDVDIRMRNQHPRNTALRLMRRDQPAIVMDGRARPEPADQAQDAAFLASCHLRII